MGGTCVYEFLGLNHRCLFCFTTYDSACVSCIEIYCFYDRTVIEFLRSFIDYSYTWG